MAFPSSDWLALLWSDSAFPAGGASHSGGLEAAVQAGHVRSMDELAPWLTDYLESVLGPCDLAAVHLSHRAARREDESALYRTDERINALKIAREDREASTLLGQRRLKTICAAHGDERLAKAWLDARAGRWRAHACCVWGLTGAIGALTETEAARGFAYSVLAAVASSAIRLALGGQQGAQDLLTSMGGRVEAAIERAAKIRDVKDLSCYAPRMEIAQMRHESARVRLFMS